MRDVLLLPYRCLCKRVKLGNGNGWPWGHPYVLDESTLFFKLTRNLVRSTCHVLYRQCSPSTANLTSGLPLTRVQRYKSLSTRTKLVMTNQGTRGLLAFLLQANHRGHCPCWVAWSVGCADWHPVDPVGEVWTWSLNHHRLNYLCLRVQQSHATLIRLLSLVDSR